MVSKYLGREDAPIAQETWEVLDKALIEAAKGVLAGRRLLHVEGPYGPGLKVVSLGDTKLESGLVTSGAIPLTLIQTTFALGMRDLAAYEQDELPLDTTPVTKAATECGRREDGLLFKGARGVPGLLTAGGANTVELSSWEEVGAAADEIIKAVTALDGAGFYGPYCLALAPARYNLLLRRYPQGNVSELEHVRTVVTEGVFKAPILESGGVLLASGRQFASITIGQDMSIGFVGPAAENFEFSISESLALIVRQPQAICVLKG